MKFSLSAQDLKRALNTCNEIAPASSVIAEEETGVLIRASGESAVFMSTDDTLSVRVEVPVTLTEEGEALVKSSSIAGAVSATFVDLDEEGESNQIKLETTAKDTLKLSGKSNTIKHIKNFPLLNASFFIETPEFEEPKATLFPAFQFMDGLSKVSHAASNDSSKSQFNCISLTLTDSEVIFAATDGVQVAEFRKAAEVQGLRGSFILGLKFGTLASKLINPALGDVQIYKEEDTFHLKSGGTVLIGALINTTFPDYAPYLDVTSLTEAVFPTTAFLEILQSMQPTVDVKSHRLVVEAKRSGLAEISTSSVSGEAESSGLEVETSSDFTFHFDSVLLQNAIRQMKGDSFQFFFSSDSAARGVVLQPTKEEDFKAFVCNLKILT